MDKPVPDPRIAEYIAEIEVDHIPYVSVSHHTLYNLGVQHGFKVVEDLIKDYFAAVREWRESQ